MAEKDDKGLIGFDPLAWMNDDANEKKDSEPMKKEIESDEVTDTKNTQPEVLVTEDVEKDLLINDSKIILGAVLNMQSVSVLYDQLLKLLSADADIEIDASAVTSIDTATLQLLIVFKQEAVKSQKSVSIDFPSESFVDAAQLLGLAEMLDVDKSAAGFF